MIRHDTTTSEYANSCNDYHASRTDMFEFADLRVEGWRLAASCVCLGDGEGWHDDSDISTVDSERDKSSDYQVILREIIIYSSHAYTRVSALASLSRIYWNVCRLVCWVFTTAFRIYTLSLIRRTSCARAQLSECSSTTNAHSETRQMVVCCQNLTIGALSSRSALSMLVGALFKKFGHFLNTPRKDLQTKTSVWFQASAAKEMRSALFRVIKVPTSRVKNPNSRPLKMVPIGCPETSVWDYHSTLHNIAEERRSHLHCDRILQLRMGSILNCRAVSLFLATSYDTVSAMRDWFCHM